MKSVWVKCVLIAVVVTWVGSVPSNADLVPPDIVGTSTASLVSDGGPYDGWYFYEIDLEWNLGQQGAGLSHWDLVLKTDCPVTDPQIAFDSPGGFSTSENSPQDPLALGWTGNLALNGDPSLNPRITTPVIKYEGPFTGGGEPGPAGMGTFSFYANMIPEHNTFTDVIVAKAGNIPDTYGTLTGAYPSCNVVPEPMTFSLLALGALFLLIRHRS